MSTSTLSAASPPAAPASEVFLTRKECADLIGVEAQTLAKWAMTGKGPRFFRINPRVCRYRKSEVLAFIEGCSSSSGQ